MEQLKEVVESLIDCALEKLRRSSAVAEVRSDRAVFIGDLHGDLETLEELLSSWSSYGALVFLGDYVDRGDKQIDVLQRVLSLYCENPSGVVLLRGNHESPLMNLDEGFINELRLTFGHKWCEVYSRLEELYKYMQLAAVVGGRVFAVHGGIPVNSPRVEELNAIKLGSDELLMPEDSTAFQLLWNDPTDLVSNFAESPRGPGAYLFGETITTSFLKKNKLSAIVRGHEYVPEGYKLNHGGRVVTVFTTKSGVYSGVRPKVGILDGSTLSIVDVYNKSVVFKVEVVMSAVMGDE